MLELGLMYLVKSFYEKRSHIIYRIDTNHTLSSDVINKAFHYRFIDTHDTDAITQVESMEESYSGRMDDFLSGQFICLCAFDNEVVVGFIVAAVGKFTIPMTNGITSSKKEFAYMDQITVRYEYRNRGIATSMQIQLLDELRKRGVRRLYARVYTYNVVAIKAAKKMGAVFIRTVRYRQVFGMKKYRYEKMGKTSALNAL